MRARTRLALALLAALSACSPEPARVVSERLALEATVSPSALQVGENELRLRLRDANGAPLDGAQVTADVRMHAMGAMPAMGGPARVKAQGDGRYVATFALEMGGTWQVRVDAHAPNGETLVAEGSLTVGTEGVRLAAAGGDAGNASPPASASEAAGAFRFDPQRIQQIGIRTHRAERRPLARTLRASARVAFDESALVEVSSRVAGWIDSLAVAAVGDPVSRGQVLFTLTSPELYAAQRELLQALASRNRAEGVPRTGRVEALVRASERRLGLLGVGPREIAEIARRGEPLDALPVRAPASGFVIEKRALAGSAVEPGDLVLRIAPSERVWLEAALPEADLAAVREGQAVRARLAGASEPRSGRVLRVLPQLRADSRTGVLRIALDAPAALRPDAFASVEIDASSGEGLVVPPSAVLRAGDRNFVFVARGDGHFEPRAVELGFESAEALEIRSGLAAGEEVVSTGTYLIASESRLRAALEQW